MKVCQNILCKFHEPYLAVQVKCDCELVRQLLLHELLVGVVLAEAGGVLPTLHTRVLIRIGTAVHELVLQDSEDGFLATHRRMVTVFFSAWSSLFSKIPINWYLQYTRTCVSLQDI